MTTVARTLVDLSGVLTRHELANVIHEAAFRNRFSLAATRDAMARAVGRRNLDVLEAALAAHAGGSAGTRSGPEEEFLALVRRAGLAEPLVNTRLAGHEVDFHWPAHRLAVEVDGGGHARPRTRAEDAARDRDLEAAGYVVLRFSDGEIRDDPAGVAARYAAACSRQSSWRRQ